MSETLEDIEKELEATMPEGPTPDEPPAEPEPPGWDGPDAEPMPADFDVDTGGLIEGLTAFLAKRLGPKWRATPEEARQIGDCLNGVLLKYAPIVARYQEESALAMAVLAYVLVRVSIPIPREIETVDADIDGATKNVEPSADGPT